MLHLVAGKKCPEYVQHALMGALHPEIARYRRGKGKHHAVCHIIDLSTCTQLFKPQCCRNTLLEMRHVFEPILAMCHMHLLLGMVATPITADRGRWRQLLPTHHSRSLLITSWRVLACNIWPLLVIFAVKDVHAFSLHRMSQRATNWGELKVVKTSANWQSSSCKGKIEVCPCTAVQVFRRQALTDVKTGWMLTTLLCSSSGL